MVDQYGGFPGMGILLFLVCLITYGIVVSSRKAAVVVALVFALAFLSGIVWLTVAVLEDFQANSYPTILEIVYGVCIVLLYIPPLALISGCLADLFGRYDITRFFD